MRPGVIARSFVVGLSLVGSGFLAACGGGSPEASRVSTPTTQHAAISASQAPSTLQSTTTTSPSTAPASQSTTTTSAGTWTTSQSTSTTPSSAPAQVAAVGGSFECTSATGDLQNLQTVSFVGCGGNTGGESQSFDLSGGDGWLEWANGDKTFLDGIDYGPATPIVPHHTCGRQMAGRGLPGEGVTGDVLTDTTGSLTVPGTLTMVICQDPKTLTWGSSSSSSPDAGPAGWKARGLPFPATNWGMGVVP